MNPSSLQQWIQHPELLNRETLYELRTLVARYPYFQSLRLLYLKNLYLLHDADFGAELRNSVLYVSDRRMLFYLIEGGKYVLEAKKTTLSNIANAAQEPDVDRTLSLIDAFLSTVPEEQTSPHMPLDYSMDYTAYLMSEEYRTETASSDTSSTETDVPKLRGQELIDGFIERAETAEVGESQAEETVKIEENTLEEEEEEPAEASPASEPTGEDLDNTYFTETLAKIYVKQQRYEKALEIIKKLSLNYPKKNAYFADQIRFLEKLIINAKAK
ncbi:MAG: tetratricopeptide repeat protein [Bacteroides sp.]|nr:tetratricopeptide repeat protein [Bacteroides sp.]